MKTQKKAEQELRKIISGVLKEQILNEENAGGDGGAGGSSVGYSGGTDPYIASGGMYGQNLLPGRVDNEDLKGIWQSIKDVFSTTAQAGKQLMRSVFTLVKTAVAGAISVVIPMFDAKYDEIFAKDKARMKEIDSKYADVTKRVEAAFGDSDVLAFAALSNFPLFMTGAGLKVGGEFVVSMLDILSAGKLSDTSSRRKKESVDLLKNLLQEDDDKNDKRLDKAAKTKSQIRDRLEGSQKVAEIEAAVKQAYRTTLQEIFNEAKAENLKTLEDVKSASGGKFKGIDVSKMSKEEKEKFEKMKPEEKKELESSIIDSVKSEIRNLAVKKLSARIKEVTDAGISANSDFVVDHQKMIEKIKQLK